MCFLRAYYKSQNWLDSVDWNWILDTAGYYTVVCHEQSQTVWYYVFWTKLFLTRFFMVTVWNRGEPSHSRIPVIPGNDISNSRFPGICIPMTGMDSLVSRRTALCKVSAGFPAFASSIVEEGLPSHQTHYRSYRGRFLPVRWPNQQCQAPKDNSWSVHQVKGQSHQAKPSTR